jgi:selenobiotic family peptide radical SAM maturase
MLRDQWLFGRKTRVFTLQWHLTNACPYHCKHCYDRSDREELPFSQALRILDDLRNFCARHRVESRVSLTGGDPLLYPHFWDLYRTVADRQIPVSILGNPIAPEAIRRLMEIQPPLYYQVSLEGLREHNDHVRSQGHFHEVMDFLSAAQEEGLRTHVMLTLTRANLDQVVPLGEELRGRTRRFTFNRVSRTGEAVDMELPTKEEFVWFLKEYILARRRNPVLGFKDNLFNVIRDYFHRPLFPGCSGFGCGAAFNFVALLPDGEVHACRKWPSPIGNIRESDLEAIYSSRRARQHRQGSLACRPCSLRKTCGGCPAVSYGLGLNPFTEKDPHCFFAERQEFLAGF